MKYEISDFNIDIKGSIFKTRPWTSLEERKFLTSGDKSLSNIAKMLILPNLEYKPLTLSEFEYILMEMRKLSIGSEVSLSVMCNCGEKLDFEKDIDELIHFISPKFADNTIKVGDIEVSFRKIPSRDLLIKVLEYTDNDEREFYEFLASISKISYKGEDNTTFTFDELEEFFDGTPSYIFRELFEKFYAMRGSLDLFCEVTCPLCKSKLNAVFNDIPSFLAK